MLPKVNFVASAVNAGESRLGISSFTGEADRYAAIMKNYVDAGCPRDGIIFVDEPGASTSSEDQSGMVVEWLVDFFSRRNVKVVFTAHNHAIFDLMKRVRRPDGKGISFLPVAFGDKPFQLEYFDQKDTERIRSLGIDVGEDIVRKLIADDKTDPEVLKIYELARYIRTEMIDKIEERRASRRHS